jgi:hypothetical protein
MLAAMPGRSSDPFHAQSATHAFARAEFEGDSRRTAIVATRRVPAAASEMSIGWRDSNVQSIPADSRASSISTRIGSKNRGDLEAAVYCHLFRSLALTAVLASLLCSGAPVALAAPSPPPYQPLAANPPNGPVRERCSISMACAPGAPGLGDAGCRPLKRRHQALLTGR